MSADISKLREALKRDFHKLYVKQFSTSWEAERFVRDTEIEIMSFDNLEKLLSAHTKQAQLDLLDELEEDYETVYIADGAGSHKQYAVVSLTALRAKRKELEDE